MFITTYKITSPRVIEEFVENVIVEDNQTLVHVDYMAVCKADIRYFLGLRSKNILDHKYPLTPIHEAVGHVIKDYTGKYKKGDKVILVPNSVNHENCKGCENDRCAYKELGENYCPHAAFCSSTKDGFLRPLFVANSTGLVKYDETVPENIAVWSELLSVSFSGCRRLDIKQGQEVAIFGDGIMAYMMYLVLHNYYNAKISVFGVDEEKMKMFKAAKTYRFDTYHGDNFDTLIECVGGRFAQDAINNMIDIARIGADLLLMGVSEENAAINTRKILEKGLNIKGVTRSTNEDFENAAKLIAIKDAQDEIKPLILSENKIKTITDIYNTIDADINNTKIIGKNLMKW